MSLFDNNNLFTFLMGNSNVPVPPVQQQPDTPPPAPTPTPVAAPAPSAAPQDDDIEIKGFSPSKISLLTRLGDLFTGNRLHMEEHIRQHDMQRALEGYSSDPRAAILRVMKIPGMASKAISMLNTVDDNMESEARGKLLEEQLKDKRLGTVRAMFNGVNDKSYGKVRDYATKYWASKGYDPEELDLPNNYDPDQIDAFRNGGMTVDQQVDNDRVANYNDKRIELSRFRAENTKNYQQARIGLAREGVGITRQNSLEKERHDRAMEDRLPAPTKANPHPGREGQIEYDPTGNYAKKFMSGKWWYFQRGSDGHHYLIKGQEGQQDENDEDDN